MPFINPCCCGGKIACAHTTVVNILKKRIKAYKGTDDEVSTKVEWLDRIWSSPADGDFSNWFNLSYLRKYDAILIGHNSDSCGSDQWPENTFVMEHAIANISVYRDYLTSGGTIVVFGEHSEDQTLACVPGGFFSGCQHPLITPFITGLGSSMKHNGWSYAHPIDIPDRLSITDAGKDRFKKAPNILHANLTGHIGGGIPLYTLPNAINISSRFSLVPPSIEYCSSPDRIDDPDPCCIDFKDYKDPSVIVSYAYEKIGKGTLIYQTDSNWYDLFSEGEEAIGIPGEDFADFLINLPFM